MRAPAKAGFADPDVLVLSRLILVAGGPGVFVRRLSSGGGATGPVSDGGTEVLRVGMASSRSCAYAPLPWLVLWLARRVIGVPP